METKKGNLSINSENMMPIIKKWLYSDHDIFVREMISNGCDAITKLHKIALMGDYAYPEDHKDSIHVVCDPDNKTLTFTDTGLGMTADEVEKYITQIAFSGASDFVKKYQDQGGKNDIIGHFGLGFYSAFMVADLVEIDTLSYQKDAVPVHWESDGMTDYTIGDGTKKETGTTIILHLNDESLEFANEYRVREVLEKYCAFMPVEIYLEKANAPQEYETIDEKDLKDTDVVAEHIHEDAKYEEQDDGNGGKKQVEVSPARERVKINKRPVPVNDIHPLWTKSPSECKPEEYKDFYRKVFNDYKEPLFWIHLNMDYPFNLRGIIYFPKVNLDYDKLEGTIKLYNSQVFIADNIKEVIPEYLMVLKGVIDCPDLPLNVSRSYLQNDGFVKKVSDYITKKVCDKLSGMCKTDRQNYEKYWDDISPFVKYGCLRDEKFDERMNDFILYKDLDGKYFTLKELLDKEKADKAAASGKVPEETFEDGTGKTEEGDAEKVETETNVSADPGAADEKSDSAPAENAEDEKKEKPKTTIYYVTNEQQQGQYINMFRQNGMDAVIFRHNIDTAYLSHAEQKNEEVKFESIDADVTAGMKDDGQADLKAETDSLTEIFRKALSNDKLEVKVEKLKNADVSSMMVMSEESRRTQEMFRMYGMDPNAFPASSTLVLNANNSLVQYVLGHKDGEHTGMICQQLYDLALLADKPLSADAMTKFIARSNEILKLIAK